jgi:hypothetical protein
MTSGTARIAQQMAEILFLNVSLLPGDVQPLPQNSILTPAIKEFGAHNYNPLLQRSLTSPPARRSIQIPGLAEPEVEVSGGSREPAVLRSGHVGILSQAGTTLPENHYYDPKVFTSESRAGVVRQPTEKAGAVQPPPKNRRKTME